MTKLLRMLSVSYYELYEFDQGSIGNCLYSGSIEEMADDLQEGISGILISSFMCGWDEAVSDSKDIDPAAFIFAQKRLLPPDAFLWTPPNRDNGRISQAWVKRDVVLNLLHLLGKTLWMPVYLEPVALTYLDEEFVISNAESAWLFQLDQLPQRISTDAIENDVRVDLSGCKIDASQHVIAALMGAQLGDKLIAKSHFMYSMATASLIGLVLGSLFSGTDAVNLIDHKQRLKAQQDVIHWVDEVVLSPQNIIRSVKGSINLSQLNAKLVFDPLAVVSKEEEKHYLKNEHALSYKGEAN